MSIEDLIENHIPIYLSDQRKYDLLKNIRESYPDVDYYSDNHADGFLQGDGWTKFDVVDLFSTEKKEISGIILSNTCDIDSENKRLSPTKLVFAPIIRFAIYKRMLLDNCSATEKIDNHLLSIKNQAVTNRFYLPKSPLMDSDYVVLLDDIHSIPVDYYLTKHAELRVRLSNAGFYIFILKLSIHFCRLFEGIDRNTSSLNPTAG
jgi:hypothetical protein